jgi:hypothetical protein
LFQLNVGRTKETWNGINCLLSKSKNSTTIPKILQHEIEITDPVTISNVFNKHFTEIGPKLAAQIPTTGAPLITFHNVMKFFNYMKLLHLK